MTLFAALAVLAASQGANAAMAWDESVNGDFSGNGLAPTLLTLNAGSNQIIGSTGSGDLAVPLPPSFLRMASTLLGLGGPLSPADIGWLIDLFMRSPERGRCLRSVFLRL